MAHIHVCESFLTKVIGLAVGLFMLYDSFPRLTSRTERAVEYCRSRELTSGVYHYHWSLCSMMKSSTLFEGGALPLLSPPHIHLMSTRCHLCDRCLQAFRFSPLYHFLVSYRRKIKGGGLGTKLCYPNKDKTSVDSHRLFMSTAPTLDSGVEWQEGGYRVEWASVKRIRFRANALLKQLWFLPLFHDAWHHLSCGSGGGGGSCGSCEVCGGGLWGMEGERDRRRFTCEAKTFETNPGLCMTHYNLLVAITIKWQFSRSRLFCWCWIPSNSVKLWRTAWSALVLLDTHYKCFELVSISMPIVISPTLGQKVAFI